MEKGLITTNITPAKIFIPQGLDPLIEGVMEKVKEFQAENLIIEKGKDRDKIRSFAMKVSKTKTFIDKARIEFVREKKAVLSIVDQEGKRFRDTLDGIRDEVRKPLIDWEEAEKDRIEKKRQLEIFNNDHKEAFAENNIFDREKILAEKEAEIKRLEEKKRQKEEAARLKKEQIERDARLKKEQIERDARLKKEAAEEATKVAERAAAEKIDKALRKKKEVQETIEKLEKERIEDRKRERESAEAAERNRVEVKKQAEKDKQAAIQKAKEEFDKNARLKKEAEEREAAALKRAEEAKAANKKHQAKINNQALACLVEVGVAEKLGKKIITAIIKGKIKGITINY